MADTTEATGSAVATDASVPLPSEDEKLLDALIFKKDLNEVHLLIDLISGRADRSLSTLTMPDPDQPSTMLTSGQILKRITLMRYPPPPDTDAMNATNAAILLMAKDRLTALADPARGPTIAYTMMFTDAEPRAIWSRLRKGAQDGEPLDRDTGIVLAAQTFPGLQAHARRFRDWRTGLGFLALVWLVLTAFTFWDTALGRSGLEHADQNWKAYIDAARDTPELVDHDKGCDIERVLASVRPTPSTTSTDATKPAGDIGRTITACRKLQYLKQMTLLSNQEITKVFGCEEMGHTAIFHMWCWHWLLSGKFAASTNPADPIQWQAATSILSVFTGYVLPMMFALLGTLIGAFRAILYKIGNSSLAPRDLVGMILGIPAGLVAGVAVGLFLSPSPSPMQGTGGIGGTFTLTASGLGFVAGYASQSFFTYLDNVVGTIFPSVASTNAHATALALAAQPGPLPGLTGSTAATGTTGAGSPTGVAATAGPTGSTAATGSTGASSPTGLTGPTATAGPTGH